jgi:uncharacterized lipoprotein YddW (UPF0748 family)
MRLCLFALVPALFLLPHMALANPSQGPGNSLSADQTPFHSFRGWWVNRWEYGNSESGIITMFNRAEQLGITDVMFQVRGQADAYYWNNDGVEARHSSVTPSFDPLAVALREAQARGMKLHAWINVAPIWLGTSMPSDPNHLVYQSPDPVNPDPYYEGWVRDHNRQRQPLNSHYVIANLTMDQVHAHINEVVKTISKNYAIDGIHLDYVRYLQNLGSTSTAITYPTDPDTLARYTADTGNTFNPVTDQNNIAKRNEYKQWMADRLTELVTQIRYTTKEHNPASQLTAAVWRDANIGFNDYQQQWDRWVQEGILDAAMPMIYRRGFASTDSGDLYRNNTRSAMSHGGSAGVMIGLGTYLQDQTFQQGYDNVMNQLIYARDQGANGVMIYNHGTLYDGHPAREGARQALADFFAQNSSAPPVLTLAGFETDNDTFTWNITVSGSNRNVASGSVQRLSGNAADGDFAQQITINKTAGANEFLARHVSGGGSPGNNLELASIGSVGFWLKTTTPDLQVAIALDDLADNSSTERSFFKNVIDDGQWHFYEWFLNDDTHWNLWAGANGNGRINNKFWLDSVQFIGTEDANVILFDEVFYDAAAVAANQWVFNPAHPAMAAQPAAGQWSHPAHWQGGVPNGVGATANLLRRSTVPATVTIDQPITLGTFNIDNDSGYTLAGNVMTLQASGLNQAAINVINRGSHVIAAPVTFASNARLFVDRGSTLDLNGALTNDNSRTLTKTGAGTLNINGPQSHGINSRLQVTRGHVNMNSNPGGGGQNLQVSISSDASIRFGGPLTELQSLSINPFALADLGPGSNRHLSTRFLDIMTGGRLEIDGHELLVINGSASGINSYVRNGLQHGFGITSASATADDQRALGILPTAEGVLVRLTWLGDANLDGRVDIADLGILAANWQQSGRFWHHGDFSYTGTVDIADLGILAGNWQAGVSGGSSMSFAEALAMFDVFDGVVVPEPACLSLLGIAGLLSLRRARHG